MQLLIVIRYNLESYKRTYRYVEVLTDLGEIVNESSLPKQLLLPRQLPQEWLPAELRTGRSGPVVLSHGQLLDARTAPEVLPGPVNGDPPLATGSFESA